VLGDRAVRAEHLVELAAGGVEVARGRLGHPLGSGPALQVLPGAVAGLVEGVDGALGRGGGVGLALDRGQPPGVVVAVFDDFAEGWKDGALKVAAAGRNAELRELAAGLVPLFRSRGIEREALASLRFLAEAVKAERVTAAVVARVRKALSDGAAGRQTART
jgi:hypothetical protein